MRVRDLLKHSCDAMKDMVIEDRLLEALRIKWKDAKMSKLEYYITNINTQYWSQYNESISLPPWALTLGKL